MSAPAMKSRLPEVMTRPFSASSFSSRSMSETNGCISASLSTFIVRPGRSSVATPMPSLSISRVMASLMVRPSR